MTDEVKQPETKVDAIQPEPKVEEPKVEEPKVEEPKKEATLDDVLDAVKELTKQLADLAKIVNVMKQGHDKWVRAGKF